MSRLLRYQELDQVVEQYLEPMNELVEAMVVHRKFLHVSFEEVQRQLLKVRREARRRFIRD